MDTLQAHGDHLLQFLDTAVRSGCAVWRRQRYLVRLSCAMRSCIMMLPFTFTYLRPLFIHSFTPFLSDLILQPRCALVLA